MACLRCHALHSPLGFRGVGISWIVSDSFQARLSWKVSRLPLESASTLLSGANNKGLVMYYYIVYATRSYS